MRSVAPRGMASALLALTSATFLLDGARGDEYFGGDGTTYTLGDTSAGNCNFMTAPAAASANYAALNNDQWLSTKNCGRCAEVSCSDSSCADKSKTEIVYILDRCPECKHGDLDLSPSVFTSITGQGPTRIKIKWKFVDCPVSGGVKYCLKGGSNNFWTAVQPANTVAGVSSMLINGQTPTMVDSAYYYLLNGQSKTQTDLGSVKVTLTSVGGETIEETVALTAGACTTGSKQFKTGNAAGSNTGGGSSGQQTTTTAPPATTTAPTSAPTSAPTPKPTTAPATPTPVKQNSDEVDRDADTPTPTPTPSSSTNTTTTTTSGITMKTLGSDAGQPGTVTAADEASSSALQRLTPAPAGEDRSIDSSSGSKAKTRSSKSSSSSSGGATEATTKASASSSSTSPVLIALAVAAVVGLTALAVVAAISRKKKLDDKRMDRDAGDRAMQRSFDNFASPVRVNSEIAEL
ncbi:hypothetical protein Gpo141_00003884 [Globisporangium polare]